MSDPSSARPPAAYQAGAGQPVVPGFADLSDDDQYEDVYPAYAPRREGRGKRILLVVLSVLAVLVVGGATAFYFIVLPVLKEANATLTTPPTVAGLTLSTDAKQQAAAETLKAQVESSVRSPTGSVAAFYNDPAAPTKSVLIMGATGANTSPEKSLDQTLDDMSGSGGLNLKNIHTVDAGPLSGYAKCGAGESAGAPVSACAWADGGSIALVLFFNRDVESSGVLFRQIRNEILTRG